MMGLEIISWYQFLTLGIILLAFYIVFSRSPLSSYLSSLFALSSGKLKRILASLFALSFIGVNPIVHTILLLLGLGLYKYYIEPYDDNRAEVKEKVGPSLLLKCEYQNNMNQSEALYKIKQALYSSSYLVYSFSPKIIPDSLNSFEVEVRLISPQYIQSLLSNISRMGFNTKLTTKNTTL